MTNISKYKIPEKELLKLFEQLNKTVAQLDAKNTDLFLSELLGHEERVMLAKRLCAVVMFAEGNSSYRVWQLLHMSPSTAEKIRLDCESGRYKNIVRCLKQKKERYEEFWRTLEIILQAGLPPRGRGRWKSVINTANKL